MPKTAAVPRDRPASPAKLAADTSRKGPTATPTADQDTFSGMGGSKVPAFNLTILRQTLQAISHPETEQGGSTDRMQAAMAALTAFQPGDEIEGMLGAQMTALHFAAMECLRRAMLPGQPVDIASKLHRDATNLCRTMAEILEALDRKRGQGPQVMRVERVVVHDGGPAVVGVVAPPTAKTEPRVA